MVTELSDERIAHEQQFMGGIPRLNIGALFLPAIWGPAHGMWAAILFYPVWLFADNMIYAAFTERTPMAIILAVIVLVTLAALTVAFAVLGQPLAAHRAASRGVEKERYLRHQRIWGIVGVVVGCMMLAAATYYNLIIRPTLGT